MPHLYLPDSVLDWFRILLFFVSAYATVILLIRYRTRGGADWNVKTKDIWYATLMWSLSGCVFATQAIALDRPFTPATVFLAAAILVTGKAVHRKGDWGNGAK